MSGRPPACREELRSGDEWSPKPDESVAGNKGDWYCYIVRCKDDSFYAGMSNDLAERIKEHNWGVKSEYTTKRRPVLLVWYEKQASREAARKRENEIKGWGRKKKMKLIAAAKEALNSASKPSSSASHPSLGVNPSPSVSNPSPSARGEGE